MESGDLSWEVFLKQDGASLTGAIGYCASPADGTEIYDGKVEGNTITFKCQRANSGGSIEFTGAIAADEIVFTWQLTGGGVLESNPVYGSTAPRRFVTKRVPDGSLAKFVSDLADRVAGAEFAAAVNIREDDLKMIGRLFLPKKVSRVRALIAAPQWGNGKDFYSNSEVRRTVEATEAGFLSLGFDNISIPTESSPASIRLAPVSFCYSNDLQRSPAIRKWRMPHFCFGAILPVEGLGVTLPSYIRSERSH